VSKAEALAEVKRLRGELAGAFLRRDQMQEELYDALDRSPDFLAWAELIDEVRHLKQRHDEMCESLRTLSRLADL